MPKHRSMLSNYDILVTNTNAEVNTVYTVRTAALVSFQAEQSNLRQKSYKSPEKNSSQANFYGKGNTSGDKTLTQREQASSVIRATREFESAIWAEVDSVMAHDTPSQQNVEAPKPTSLKAVK